MTSLFYDYIPKRDADTLFINISARNCTEGKFNFYKTHCEHRIDRLLLNCPDNKWYTEGVPGLAGSMEELEEKLLCYVKPNHRNIVFAGSSMGAWAAMYLAISTAESLPGVFVRCIAFGLPAIIGIPGSKSVTDVKNKEDFEDLHTRINKVRNIDAYIFAGEYSQADIYGVYLLRDCPKIQYAIIPGAHHGVAATLNQNGHMRDALTSYVEAKEIPGCGRITHQQEEEIFKHYDNSAYLDGAFKHLKSAETYEAAEQLTIWLKSARQYNRLLEAREKWRLSPDAQTDFDIETLYLFKRAKRYRECLEFAFSLADHQSEPRILYYIAFSYMKTNKEEEARRIIEQAIDLCGGEDKLPVIFNDLKPFSNA